MKTTKRAFDLIFIIISALILITLSEYGLLEKHMAFLLIPVLIAYFLGQYSQRKLTQSGTVKRFW
jgi:predicted membrane protein